MISKAFLLLITSLFLSCKQRKACPQLASNYSSYDSAVSFIEKNSYSYKDSILISGSKTIKGANYYSCDGKSGFFIFNINIEVGKFVRTGVPLKIWEEFKASKDKDSFFNAKIDSLYSSGIKIVQEIN